MEDKPLAQRDKPTERSEVESCSSDRIKLKQLRDLIMTGDYKIDHLAVAEAMIRKENWLV